MAQKTKNTILEMKVRKADNGYIVITEYENDDIPNKIHVSTNIDDVFATIEKMLM